MARRLKNKKNLIICICGAVAAVAVIALIIVLVVMNNRLNDGYFKTDDSKYVFSVDTSELTDESEENPDNPVKIHEVYTHDGDTITSHKYYYEFKDEDAAKNALETEKENAGDNFESIEQNGKYIVLTLKAEDYEGTTASDVEKFYKLYEERKASNEEETEESEETKEETEETEEKDDK